MVTGLTFEQSVYATCVGRVSAGCGERCSRVRSDGRRRHRPALGRGQGGVHRVDGGRPAGEHDGRREQHEENDDGARWQESQHCPGRL